MATYIYQRPEWPEFRWSESGIATDLARVRHRQGRLIGRMEGLGFQLREEAVLNQTLGARLDRPPDGWNRPSKP